MLLIVSTILLSAPVTTYAMQIFVRTSDTAFISLEVEPTDRIADVKAQIEAAEGIPSAYQTLIFAGQTLEEGNTLQDYSIQKDSTLRLTVQYPVIRSATCTTVTLEPSSSGRYKVDDGAWQAENVFTNLIVGKEYIFYIEIPATVDGTPTLIQSIGLPYTLSHNYTSYSPDGNATCVTNETETSKCSYCDTINTWKIANSVRHILEKNEDKAATCNENGYAAYWKCNACGLLFSDEKGVSQSLCKPSN